MTSQNISERSDEVVGRGKVVEQAYWMSTLSGSLYGQRHLTLGCFECY